MATDIPKLIPDMDGALADLIGNMRLIHIPHTKAAKIYIGDPLIPLSQPTPFFFPVNEKEAIAHFTALRWKNGEFCPYCRHDKIYHFSDAKNHKCAQCKQRFSIKVGTIFEDSKLPLRTWMLAIWFITACKGISSVQLAHDLGVTQKTSWWMMRKLRNAAKVTSFKRKIKNGV